MDLERIGNEKPLVANENVLFMHFLAKSCTRQVFSMWWAEVGDIST